MQNNQSTTSFDTSSFNKNFEAEVNDNMNPSRDSISKDQKGPTPSSSHSSPEADDHEYNEKMAMKDQHQLPPRFSTIFDTKRPATPTRAFESYPQHPVRKSGVYIAKPLFWALFAIFLFESAVLFAYTVIGLVSNMSSKLHINAAGAVVAGCDCSPQPINISPNFFMPGASQGSVVETTTTLSTSISTTSTSSSSSSSTQSISDGVSQLADIIKSAGTSSTSESSTHTPTTHVVTVTPPGPTIRSTVLLTVDPSGSTIPPRSTITSTKVVDAEPSPSLDSRDETTSIVSTIVSVSMVSVTNSSPAVPTMSLALKSHQELANKPTQEAEIAPSPSTEPANSEPSETVSSPSTTNPEPTPTCTKGNHMWGASGRIWGGKVCK